MTHPEKCSTCGEPYTKLSTADGLPRGAFCSNGFHCCRDCTWVDGRRTFLCAPCVEWENQAKADFIPMAILQWRDDDPTPERNELADICATRMNHLEDSDSVEDLLTELLAWRGRA